MAEIILRPAAKLKRASFALYDLQPTAQDLLDAMEVVNGAEPTVQKVSLPCDSAHARRTSRR